MRGEGSRSRRRLGPLVVAVCLLASLGPVASAEAPQVTITSPLQGDVVDSAELEVAGTASSPEGVQVVRVRVDDGPYVTATLQGSAGQEHLAWTASVPVAGFVDGHRTVTALMRDGAGQSVEAAVGFVLNGGLDVALRIASFHGEVGLGGTTDLQVTVANDGDGGVEGVTADLAYLDDGAWVPLTTLVFDLAAGAQVQRTHTWQDATKVGRFDVHVVVDAGQMWPEADETDNAAFGSAAFWTDAVEGMDLLDPPVPGVDDPLGAPVTHEILILGGGGLGGTGDPVDVYAPHALTIRQGDRIVWRNVAPDGLPHSALRLVLDGYSFDTGPLAPGASSEPIVFGIPTTHQYTCGLHAGIMPTGQIVVLPV